MKRTFNRKHLIWIIPVAAAAVLTVVFLIYAGSYYHAEDSATEALASGGGVEVSQTDYGWYFDGPSEDSALVFYPGAKVEETAYAPLLHRLAAEGMDACLVKMPLRFAFLGKNKAGKVMEQYDYDRWFVGGHSLGGAMSAYFAADHGDEVEGVILLGAYNEKALDDSTAEIVIYGTQDGIATMEEIEKGRKAAPPRYAEYAIEGGNHAGFGNYGKQKGDGTAVISGQEQQAETIRLILEAAASGKTI